jgi:hypothetical protein
VLFVFPPAQYMCDDYDADEGVYLNMTVKAFLQNAAQRNEGNVSSILSYSGDATLSYYGGDNMTVTHSIKTSNRDDYLGQNVVRSVSYDAKNSTLLLTPHERMLGVTFALLWMPAETVM